MKPLAEEVRGCVRLALWCSAAAVVMVMLIVCANLSSLLLARTASQQKESRTARLSAPEHGVSSRRSDISVL